MKSILIQILIGTICGLILGFFSLSSITRSKDRDMRYAWSELNNALNNRYSRLRAVLSAIKFHMPEYVNQIEDLDKFLSDSTGTVYDLYEVDKAIVFENAVNKRLEDIKTAMSGYSSLAEDNVIQEAINKIEESEIVVGEAIQLYNGAQEEYTTFLEVFPITIVARIIGVKADSIIKFVISQIQEFDDNYYIDEEDI